VAYAGLFDVIIASDVVYLPECVEPLVRSLAYFLKPQSGVCVFVNNRVRIDKFQSQIDALFAVNMLDAVKVEEVVRGDDRKFKIHIIKKT
jgi:hypothetical protein